MFRYMLPLVRMSQATILHVEDDSNDTLLFQHACRKAGMDVNLKSVPDGEEALAYLKAAQHPEDREHPLPNLVLLDLKLPRVNGFDVLSWMRGERQLRRLPVIVLTSSSHEADVRRAYDLGANSFLIKPVAFEALVRIAESIKHYWLGLNRRPAV